MYNLAKVLTCANYTFRNHTKPHTNKKWTGTLGEERKVTYIIKYS